MEQSPTKKRRAVLPKAPPSRLRKTPKRPDLSVEQILRWADAHHKRTGRWPTTYCGYIQGTIDDTWQRINIALTVGTRGLPRNSGLSLARLLEKRRGVRNPHDPPLLTAKQILTWVKSHLRRTGRRPTRNSGKLLESPQETWRAIDTSLRRGIRGLPGDSSLAQFLVVEFGATKRTPRRPLNQAIILKWADAHYKRTGDWPRLVSGTIPESPNDTWKSLSEALNQGYRGLPGGFSLAKLLARERGARTTAALHPLTHAQILLWCDAHHARTGRWPKQMSGAIHGAPGETWIAVDASLRHGRRTLPGGLSLAQLLARKRGRRNHMKLQRLTYKQILHWCDAHRRRTGKWPIVKGGPVADAPGETWGAISMSLTAGLRGLPGGMTLPRLLELKRGVRNQYRPPQLSVPQILRWCKAHQRRTGEWPTGSSGPIPEAPGETWEGVNRSFRLGFRGLPNGLSLEKLHTRRRKT